MDTLRVAAKTRTLPTTKSALDTTDITAIRVRSCDVIFPIVPFVIDVSSLLFNRQELVGMITSQQSRLKSPPFRTVNE